MTLFPQSAFARNALTLMTGTAIAQTIPVATAPILTRLYTPDEFGIAAIFAAIAGILSTVATLKYEQAIMMPHDESDAEQLVLLSLVISALVSAILFVVVLLGNARITQILGTPAISNWLYLIPVTVFFAGANQTFNYWLNRHQKYREMSRVRVTQSCSTGAVSVGMGFTGIGAGGLILGGVAAHAVTAILVGRRYFDQKRPVDLPRTGKLAKEYSNHPRFLLPSHLISATHEQFTIFFIAALFASTVAGYFSLAYRVAVLPSTLLANAVGDVFRQTATELYHQHGQFREFFVKTLIRVFLISLLPYAIIILEAPAIFAFVFGEPWRVAGEYARILSIAFLFVTAVDRTPFVLGATRYIFIWNALRLAANLVAAAIAWKLGLSVLDFLYLFTVVNILFFVADTAIGYKLSSGGIRHEPAGASESTEVRNIHITLTSFRHESRLLKESRSLVDAGQVNRVLVIALHEPGLAEEERLDSTRSVVRLRLLTRNLPWLLRPIKYLELGWRVMRLSRQFGCDIVNVHTLDLLPLGVILKTMRKCALVYDAHELETEIAGRSRIRAKFARLVERALIRFADLTIVVSRGIEAHYRRAYGDMPIVTVMNCPPTRHAKRTGRLRERLSIPAHSRIYLYQGGLENGRGIALILETFKRMRDDRRVVVFMGYGTLEADIRAAAETSANVFFLPAVPPAEVLDYTSSADVGLVLIENSSLSYYHSLPNKLFESLMGGLPVIVSDLPEMARVVDDEKVGVIMREASPDGLLDAIERLEALQAASLEHAIDRTRRKYCWEAQEVAMIDAYRLHAARAQDLAAGSTRAT